MLSVGGLVEDETREAEEDFFHWQFGTFVKEIESVFHVHHYLFVRPSPKDIPHGVRRFQVVRGDVIAVDGNIAVLRAEAMVEFPIFRPPADESFVE